MAAQIEAPQNLADLLTDKQRVRDAFALLNAISTMDLRIVAPEQYNRNEVLVGNPQGVTLTLPLKIATPIANSTTNTTSLSTQLNTLLSGLRDVGILPP